MIVYIVRHGAAVDIGQNGVKQDKDRMLSAEGRRRTRQAAEGLKRIDCRPAHIVSSPLVRAFETAEIVRNVLAPKKRIETTTHLKPDADLDLTLKWLAEQGPEALMLVGHNPDLEILASSLLAGSAKINILLKKSAACCISFPGKAAPGTGGIEWLIQPKMLRQLAVEKP